MTDSAILVLEDGTVFEGVSVGAPGLSVGEVVFNTAMTGYQEVLTDPSYARQLVTLTYPHIGNTGCTDQDDEASRVWCAGLIVRDVPRRPSSWRNQQAQCERQIKAIAALTACCITRSPEITLRGKFGRCSANKPSSSAVSAPITIAAFSFEPCSTSKGVGSTPLSSPPTIQTIESKLASDALAA
mgnify:CR=1 FL=1